MVVNGVLAKVLKQLLGGFAYDGKGIPQIDDGELGDTDGKMTADRTINNNRKCISCA